MENILIHNIKDEKFKVLLSHLIDFVEGESSRIDEERRGAYRRDGGRIMVAHLFLESFIREIGKMENAKVIQDLLSMKKEAHNEQEAITVDMLNDIVYRGETPSNVPATLRKLQFVKVYDIIKYAVKNNINLPE